MAARVAINGLGRIGRATLKIVLDTPDLDLVAVNDIAPPENLAYLLKYDSVYGRYNRNVEVDEGGMVLGRDRVRVLAEKDPSRLPWGDMGIDLVFECTGIFTNREGLQKHIDAGAGRVVLSAPAKGDGIPTVVHGANESPAGADIISCASCTTNCITPVVEVIGRRIGIRKAIMTTVHAYTTSQGIVDGPAKKMRRGRAGAANIVPTSTGAADATTEVLPQYAGRFDGLAIRVPVPVGSLADIVFLTDRETTVGEVNGIFREEAASNRYQGILTVTDDEIVSSDVVQDPSASIVDLSMTQVVDGDMLKVLAWYDNEWGYAAQMVREAKRMIAG